MNFTELKPQIDILPEDEQDKLAAYLTMLRKIREESFEEELSAKIADTDSEQSKQWVSLKQLTESTTPDD